MPKQLMTEDRINDVIEIETYLGPQLLEQEQKSGKQNPIVLLVITVILFFSTKIVSTDIGEIFVLIAVLLLHEIGHFVAMKWLGYHDVKMFFIPFLGAAVSGKSKNDSAIKSCFVSIMGPFPGLILGLLLFSIGFGITKNYYVYKTAEVMILLNVFNVLPIMPLDGGRYIDILFIKNRVFRLIFGALGISLLIILGITSSDLVLTGFGLLALWNAIATFRITEISRKLAKAGVRINSVEELAKDTDKLRMVTTIIYNKAPKLFEPRINFQGIYRWIGDIVGSIRFKAAGIPAKLGMIFLYFIIVLFAIIVAIASVARDYKEKVVTKYANGIQYRYSQRYEFGKLDSEIPIAEDGTFDGNGVAYYKGDTTRKTLNYAYENGFRNGDWTYFDTNGNVYKKDFYTKGTLDSTADLANGVWKVTRQNEMPFLSKLSNGLSRKCQPYRSLARHFEKI